MNKISILFLSANPKGTSQLRLDEEARTIEQRLRLSKNWKKFDFHTQWATQTQDILDALLRFKPQIIHFSGHGNEKGDLAFEREDGREKMVGMAGLAVAIAGIGTIQCVVLNACFSNKAALALNEEVGCVVGMNGSVDDEAAIDFVSGFYRSVGDGMSMKKAFELGRAQVMIDGGDSNIPQIRLRNDADFSL